MFEKKVTVVGVSNFSKPELGAVWPGRKLIVTEKQAKAWVAASLVEFYQAPVTPSATASVIAKATRASRGKRNKGGNDGAAH